MAHIEILTDFPTNGWCLWHRKIDRARGISERAIMQVQLQDWNLKLVTSKAEKLHPAA